MSEHEACDNRGKRRNFYRGGRGGFRQGGGYRGGFQDKGFHKRPGLNHYHKQKRTKFEVTNRLKEVDIGVTEFVGKHERINGIVKERFNDFHVHEISIEGERSQLTNQDIPVPPEDALDLNELKKNLPQETFDQIESLSKPDAEVNSVEIDVTDMDKEQRRMLHTIGKKIPSIVSQTIEKDQKKLLVLAKNTKKQPAPKFYKDARAEWNYPNNFCHFVLHKMNMDTMDTLNLLAMHLRLRPNSFTYSGTKDRRARTTQWICLKRVHPSNILEAGKRIRGAFVGNFKFAKEPLRLGQLKGNHFTIVLRNVTASDEEISNVLTSLRDNGFINYYGLQRFGTVAAVPTHDIGKALLQGNWNLAIELILKPRTGEFVDMAEAREIYAKTKDAKQALSKIQRQDKIEAKLLRGIIQAGNNNPQGALDALPRNTRTMYIHAYQSFVWNHLVSRRIRELGSNPIVGDLVYEKRDTNDTAEAPEVIDEVLSYEPVEQRKAQGEDTGKKGEDTAEQAKEEKNTVESQMAVDPIGQELTIEPGNNLPEETSVMDEKMEVQEEGKEQQEQKDKSEKAEAKRDDEPIEKDFYPLPTVKILTEEDLPNYTLADVVMPQPGWRVSYPEYAKQWYEELLAKDGLTTDLRQRNQKYSLGGQYRKILQMPEDMSWKIVLYNDLQVDLVLADIDKMRNHELPKDEPDGKYKALILEMTLRSSTYATMALREILKHDTSAETQAAQSAAHHAQDKENRRLEAAEKINGEEATQSDLTQPGDEAENENGVDGVESVADEATDKMEIADEPTSHVPAETAAVPTSANSDNN